MQPDQNNWQPQTILRFIESFDTSASTTLVATDAGDGYLKPLGNPTGPHLLACEWVGTNLAKLFGLSTFDFALIQITEDDEIPLSNGNLAQQGTAFITRKEDGFTWGGSVDELQALENPQDISRLVVFDTWTLNCDRHHPDKTKRKPHYDNVFLSSENTRRNRFRLKAMDHTHCFTCGRDLTNRLVHIDLIQDEQIYGLFSGFLPYLKYDAISRAINDLNNVTQNDVDIIVQAIPNEWEVSEAARQALTEFIIRRAAFIIDDAERIIKEIYNATNKQMRLL
jgi:hypothetical protein